MTAEDPFRRRRAIEMRTPRDTRFQPHTALGDGAEFDAIRRMIERWGPAARRIGDDAAVITTPGERSLVASTDTSVENVHFKREWLTPVEIGYRAAASALSDLAAMGAKPLGMLVAMAIPEHWRRFLDPLTDGIGEAALAADAPVLGGDMSKGAELALTVTVLGTARDVLYRTAARPGDHVYLTGTIGSSGAALSAFLNGDAPSSEARARFARPIPRIREG
ncbi:MAG TPA: thiamine-phosphate kinase, partial [Gemmatimonadaceae bacterium]|nr:thiamine-phosphate kinase [Gemmatimonadaceae bacterium]